MPCQPLAAVLAAPTVPPARPWHPPAAGCPCPCPCSAQPRRQRAPPPAGPPALRLLLPPVPALRPECPRWRGPGHARHPRSEPAANCQPTGSVDWLASMHGWCRRPYSVRPARASCLCSHAAPAPPPLKPLCHIHALTPTDAHAHALSQSMMPHTVLQGEMCRMLREAGFGSAEVLDWQHPMNRHAWRRAWLMAACMQPACSPWQPLDSWAVDGRLCAAPGSLHQPCAGSSHLSKPAPGRQLAAQAAQLMGLYHRLLSVPALFCARRYYIARP